MAMLSRSASFKCRTLTSPFLRCNAFPASIDVPLHIWKSWSVLFFFERSKARNIKAFKAFIGFRANPCDVAFLFLVHSGILLQWLCWIEPKSHSVQKRQEGIQLGPQMPTVALKNSMEWASACFFSTSWLSPKCQQLYWAVLIFLLILPV